MLTLLTTALRCRSIGATSRTVEEAVFRKKKGPGGVQGYDRISRLMEDRQHELAGGDTDSEELEEDTIVLRSSGAASEDHIDEESVSLFDVRGRGAQPLVEPYGDEERRDAQPAYDDSASSGGLLSPAATYDDRESYAAPASMPLPNMAVAGGSSLVATEAVWEGKLRSEGDIRIEGTLRGEIDTTATLIVAPHARIHGTVRARNMMLAGDVEGDITCEERLEILPGGSARGQINSGTLVVHEGAYIDSRFQMRREPMAPGS